MRKAFAVLLLAASFWASYSYYQKHLSKKKRLAADTSQDDSQLSQESVAESETPNAAHAVSVTGALADWMQNRDSSQTANEAAPRKPHPSDHIAPSPVGTSNAIVRKTFAVASTTNFLFEVPPHAASPQLHGTYRSCVRNSGVQSSDDGADVDLLLMNDQQFADYTHGRDADVVYSVDSSHEQDVSFLLPATLDRPVQYYLVFRNSTRNAGKKVVQADFRVDF
jgi:hypothetical protein